MKTDQRLQWGEELALILDDIDRREDAIRETMKEMRGNVAKLEKRARYLRDLLSGRKHEQVSIEESILSAARAVAERETTGGN